ncbi:hypothetical protein [Vreelandella titanicae]|uniref:Uncharacterized protein n=1 Tax=Vreelandella titanicae TaxID=664683 RepID=A0AAP9NQP0_9GAMM|nr:hypothetical protein [Halomonas titanicae]QKS26728.1 hypothetical protein FX987_04544 [Halomonas titanicae]
MSQQQKKTHFKYPKNLIIKVVSLEDAIKIQYSNGIECTPDNLANTEIKDFTYYLQSILSKYIEDLKLDVNVRIENTFFIDTEGEHEKKYIGMLFLENQPNQEELTHKLAQLAYEIASSVITQKDILSIAHFDRKPSEDNEFIAEHSEKFINKKNGRSIKHPFTVTPSIDNKKQPKVEILVSGQYCAPKFKAPETTPVEGYAIPAGFDEYGNSVSLYSIDSNHKVSNTPFTLTANHADHIMTLASAKINNSILYYTGDRVENPKGPSKQKTYVLSTLSIVRDESPDKNFQLQQN